MGGGGRGHEGEGPPCEARANPPPASQRAPSPPLMSPPPRRALTLGAAFFATARAAMVVVGDGGVVLVEDGGKRKGGKEKKQSGWGPPPLFLRFPASPPTRWPAHLQQGGEDALAVDFVWVARGWGWRKGKNPSSGKATPTGGRASPPPPSLPLVSRHRDAAWPITGARMVPPALVPGCGWDIERYRGVGVAKPSPSCRRHPLSHPPLFPLTRTMPE